MSKHYVSAEDKYKDNLEAAISLLIVGTLGIAGLVLINLDIINLKMAFRSKVFASLFLGALFVFFIVFGIKSIFISKKYKSGIQNEVAEHKKYNDYIKENITREVIDSHIAYDEDTTPEEAYIYRVHAMFMLLKTEFPEIDEVLADELIEANYENIYPSDEE
jgi:hypothetical protein